VGVAHFQKSLHTKDLGIARRLCLDATVWFRSTMERLRAMSTPTRADFEAAAAQFFQGLAREVDRPRSFPADGFSQAVNWNAHLSGERIRELDRQLVSHGYDPDIDALAERMLTAIDTSLPSPETPEGVLARQLAARAARQVQRYFIHQITAPFAAFEPDDPVFRAASGPAPTIQPTTALAADPIPAGLVLGEATKMYLRQKELRGLGQSQIDETARLLNWLIEELGSSLPVRAVTRDRLRTFRDDLRRIDVTLRGRPGAFRDRLTNVEANHIKSATYLRYWKAGQAFFAWLLSEGHAEDDPAASLKMEKRKGETKRTPEPFSKDELLALFATPLFAGCQSLTRLKVPGDCHVRGDHWWAAVLLMHTGLRAGELSQFFPGDFVFNAETPHLKVREEDESGQKVKTTKNAASIRDVPLHPNLIELGLRQFVEGRAKRYPKRRVFAAFRLGTRGRVSDGMTRFWRDYLHETGLWKEGRATHVWRHTVVASLREQGAAEEDIGAFVGHKGVTITSRYGGARSLARKAKTAELLGYGFDVVKVLGGPFDPKKHLA
jgi:integrase